MKRMIIAISILLILTPCRFQPCIKERWRVTSLPEQAAIAPALAQNLLELAATFPAMPREVSDLAKLVNRLPTFTSGTPYNDLEYTLFDTDYVDGETNGYDTFLPVDPSDEYPGSDTIRLIKATLHIDLDSVYGGAAGDRIILGTAEITVPFFLRGPDGLDNDYAVIQNFDYNNGHIQLRGQRRDYELVYCTQENGCATEGWYLFYTVNNANDLVAFIFPCDDIGLPVSGQPPRNPLVLCNPDKRLSLDNPNQFRYAQPVSTTPAYPQGLTQFGSNGKEIIGGLTVDQNGNSYLFGATDGNLGSSVGAGDQIFIAKINPSGRQEWVAALPATDGSLIFDAVTDAQYLYACGRTLGALPGFKNAGRWDVTLLKIKLDTGEIVAMNQWGNQGIDGCGNITLDDAGNLYISGQGSPDGQGSQVGQAGTDKAYLVAKHRTADLSNVWRVLDEPPGRVFGAAEAWGGITYRTGSVPGDGRLVVAGWSMTTGGADAFIVVYQNLNAARPQRAYVTTLASRGMKADWILDNAVDQDGNIYVVGYTTGNLQGSHLGAEGDAFIARYDPTLSKAVFKQIGTSRSDQFRKLVIDEIGNLYALGYTYGTYRGENSDPTHTTADIFIQEFDPNLNLLGALQFGTPNEDRGYLYWWNNSLYVGGMTESSMVNANLGSFDGFVIAVPERMLKP
jgi:hypothetical protein